MAKALKIRKIAPDDSPETAAVRIMRTRLREFFSHWPKISRRPTAAQLHALRISGKRLRYSAESLRDLYPDRLTLLLNLLRQIQDKLGEMQDYETQRALITADLARRQSRPQKPGVAARRQNYASADSPDAPEAAGEIHEDILAVTEDPVSSAMDSLLQNFQKKQEKRFAEFELLWRGISSKKFRAALKELVSRPHSPAPAEGARL